MSGAIRGSLGDNEWFSQSDEPETHLLKKRGIRNPSDRAAGVVPPKFGVPPCCRGMEM